MRKHTFWILGFLLLTFSIIYAQRAMRSVGKDGVLAQAPYRASWALLIGINTYPNLPVQYQLHYSVNDVEELKQVLMDQYQFPESNITTLTDEQATYQNIRDKMGQLSDPNNVDSNDRVLVYFSGHGQTVPLPRGGEMGFIIPYDADVDMDSVDSPSAYYSTCLAMDELKRLARMIPAKHVLFLVDACYSGLVISSRGGLQPSIPGYLRKVASLPVQQVITAGLAGDESYENPDWGHGAFTYKLLEALRTGVADENEDGVITGLELAAHLRNVVPNISPSQTPQYGYFEGEGEFLFLRSELPPPVPTAEPAQDQPVRPRDLTKIAFVSERGGSAQIYSMNADGTDMAQITSNTWPSRSPSWSPDGARIAYTDYRDFNGEIYVMNADGSNPKRLIGAPGWDWQPSWSPDGTKIAFMSSRDIGKNIHVMNADGTDQVNLTNDLLDCRNPSWSPDGMKIVFEGSGPVASVVYTGRYDIYVMNTDGTDKVNLTNHPALDVHPSWSPDGTKIAFASDRDGNSDIFVMNADGTNPIRLTSHPARDDSPCWSPDGAKIAFASYRDRNNEIYVINADGTNLVRLTNNPAWDDEPAWSPFLRVTSAYRQ